MAASLGVNEGVVVVITTSADPTAVDFSVAGAGDVAGILRENGLSTTHLTHFNGGATVDAEVGDKTCPLLWQAVDSAEMRSLERRLAEGFHPEGMVQEEEGRDVLAKFLLLGRRVSWRSGGSRSSWRRRPSTTRRQRCAWDGHTVISLGGPGRRRCSAAEQRITAGGRTRRSRWYRVACTCSSIGRKPLSTAEAGSARSSGGSLFVRRAAAEKAGKPSQRRPIDPKRSHG